MSDTLYTLTVPMFNKMLGALLPIFEKAKSYAVEKKFDESVLINARLAPDMFALARQVQVSTDFAKGCAARLSQTEVPKYDDAEKSFDELAERVQKTLAFINSIDPAKFDDAQSRIVKLTMGGQSYELDGLTYVRDTAMPNFFFHLTSAYAILRHNGVAIGKNDYLARG
jgi:uncharacterized protein